MRRDRQLAGQTLVVIGGTSGIGLETARQACEDGAHVIVTARDPEGVHRIGVELGASIAAFDAADFDRLARFFNALSTPIEHVLLTAHRPYDVARADVEQTWRDVDSHLLLPLQVAENAGRAVRPGGSLLFVGCIRGRSTLEGLELSSGLRAALRAMTKKLALELAPIRVNMLMIGSVDTPPSAAFPADQVEARRAELRSTLPIQRVVGPADAGALAIHLMTSRAITGAIFDIDGGQKLVER
jgi:NAD(P)-dependent dehydrogenase (short-subunit alcohol dehydrogenase family)